MIRDSVQTTETAETPQPIGVEPMQGPGDPTGLRRCIHCLQEFADGDVWLRLTPIGGGYAIGIHVRCYLDQPVD